MKLYIIALLAAISYAQTVDEVNVDLEISILEKELEEIAIDGANSVSRKLLSSGSRSSSSRSRSTKTTRSSSKTTVKPGSKTKTTAKPKSGSSLRAFPTTYYTTPSYGLNSCNYGGSSYGYSQNQCSNGQYSYNRYGSAGCSGAYSSQRTTNNLNTCTNRRNFYGDDLHTTINCNNGRATQRLCGKSNKQNCYNRNATSTGCTMHMCGELCCIDKDFEAFVHSFESEATFKGSCVCGTTSASRKRETELKSKNMDTIDFYTCTEYNQWVANTMRNSVATLSSGFIIATLAWKML